MVQPSAQSPPEAPTATPRSHLATLLAGAAALTLASALTITSMSEGEAGGIATDTQDREEDPVLPASSAAEDAEIVLGYPRGQLTPGQEHLLAVAREGSAEMGRPLRETDVPSGGYNNGIKRRLSDETLDVALTFEAFANDVCRGFDGAEASAPVARLLDTLLLPSGNPNDLNGLEDVVDQDLVLGVSAIGPHRERAEAAGIAERNLVNSETEFLDVEDGEVDAFLGDSQDLTWQVQARQSELEVTEPLIPAVDGEEVEEYTGFYVSDPEFAEELDEVLATMRADGRLRESGEEWGMTEDHQPSESMGQYEVCGLGIN